jgi:6-pyruvoyltetrahydropterin/6-carboxytetrahydropterin synthase
VVYNIHPTLKILRVIKLTLKGRQEMTWIIDKTFEFCYGHRVWTQKLNGEYAADLKCACRHLHGHEGKLQVYLTGDGLDSTGMVTDFRHLEWLKKWINENIDHQFIIDRHDPLYNQIVGDRKLVTVTVPNTEYFAGYKIDLTDLEPNTPEYEYYEGFFVVEFVPTSENLSSWIAELVQTKMQPLNVRVHHIDWWETPKSRSVFYRD